MDVFRRRLDLKIDTEFGPFLVFYDWEHLDYIEDVLIEHFDINSYVKVDDKNSGVWKLYFVESDDVTFINSAILEINDFHKSELSLFSTK